MVPSAQGSGTLEIFRTFNGKTSILTFWSVLNVPRLSRDSISVSKLLEHGFDISVTPQDKVITEGDVMVNAGRHESLYLFRKIESLESNKSRASLLCVSDT